MDLNILDIYSVFIAILSTLFAVVSGFLTYIGYFKFKKADTLVKAKVQEEIKNFRNDLEDILLNIQDANQKVSSSYKFFETKEYDKSIAVLLTAEKIYPKAFNLYNTLGYAYQAINDLTNAEFSFKKAILYHPKRIEGYNDLANFYLKIGNEKKAKQIKEQATKAVANANELWQEWVK